MAKVEILLAEARRAFKSGKTWSLSFRRSQLQGLLRMYDECQDEITTALHKDLRKPKMEGALMEIEVLKVDARDILRNLEKWTKSEKLPTNLLTATDNAYIRKDPLGVVLIIGTWNYPFNMALAPLAGAIAAGNCAVVKPSEMSAHSSATMARILPRYLDPECYHVFEGDAAATVELLKHQFDYIFYTGSCNVGKSIMEAAAKHLTPVTLELGGKSPVYIHDDVNIEQVAKRVLWGKFVNLGQTCIAPDYVLMSSTMQQKFLDASVKVLHEWYGSKWQESKDLTRIINQRHFQRLKTILDLTKGRIALGGETDEKTLWIAPTIVVDVNPNTDATMEQEIFGPILPIINVRSPEEAIQFILDRPKPLALYVFSNRKSVTKKFVTNTSSGGVCINDVVWQCGWEGLPFGGVGNSGFGNYHGKFSVDTFTHKKAVLNRGTSTWSEKLTDPRYPPYTDWKLKFFTAGLGYHHLFELKSSPWMTHTGAALLGAVILLIVIGVTGWQVPRF